MNKDLTKKKVFKVPHTYVIIFTLLIVMSILTYIIPAGEYGKMVNEYTNKEVVNPDDFNYVEQQGVKLMQVMTSVTRGMQKSGSIIFFIFIIGGAMQIIFATGAINKGIASLVHKTQGKGKIFIPIFMFVFALGGMTFGLSNEIVVFVPMAVSFAHAMGYDSVTGVAMIALGAAVGYNTGIINPFTTGLAQGLSGLPIFSGITLRIIMFVIMFPITLWYILKYADKVHKDPSQSLVADCECETEKKEFNIDSIETMTLNDKLVLSIFAAGIAIMVYGVFFWGWYMDEMAGIFMFMGIVCGFIGKLSAERICREFVAGAKEMTFGALVIGIASGMMIVMQEGKILDTLIHWIATVIIVLPRSISAVGMYLFLCVYNLFVPSSSGMAASVMPIMTSLSDVIGVTRQTAVLAYQFGDGFSNSIVPTNSVLMSYLAISKIPYEKWFKFILPITAIWVVMGVVFMVIATAINYGPF